MERPLRKILIVAALLLSFVCVAFAQDQSSKLDIAVGYAGLKQNISSNLDLINLGHPWENGWQASIAYNPFAHVGIEVQGNGFYKGLHIGNNIPFVSSLSLGSYRLYTVTVGPTVKFSTTKVQPYVHALFGIANAGVGTGGILSFLPIPTDLSHFNTTNFAADLGGGLDYMVVPHVGLRVEAADLLTHFPLSTVALTSGNTQNNFKIMGGVTFHF
jgi:hypothetical protein